MKNKLSFFLLIFSISSCNVQEVDDVIIETSKRQEIHDSIAFSMEIKPIIEVSAIEKTLIRQGLVNIKDIDSSILIDVRYSTTQNFMGEVLYENYNQVYLQKEVAIRLQKAQNRLKSLYPDYSLKVFDGARPRFVQQQMWEAMDSIPVQERTKFLSNPANGSSHNYGCAVDLTIVNTMTGKELDMGAGYDDIRKIAYPRHEEEFLERGELTPKHIENRKLLRNVMQAGGFWVIQTEWWHFNAYSREKAQEIYEIIE